MWWVGDGVVVSAPGKTTEVVVPEVVTDVVLGEPWDSKDKVVVAEGGDVKLHHFHVAEHVHDYLGGVRDDALPDGAAVNNRDFVRVVNEVQENAVGGSEAWVHKT